MKLIYGVLVGFFVSTQAFSQTFTKENLDSYKTKSFFWGLNMAFERAGGTASFDQLMNELQVAGANSGGALDYLKSVRDSDNPRAKFEASFKQMNDAIMADLKARNMEIRFSKEMDELSKARVLYRIHKEYPKTVAQKWPLMNIFIGNATNPTSTKRPLDVFVSSDLESKMNTLFKKDGAPSMSERLGWTAEREVFETFHPLELNKPIPNSGLVVFELDPAKREARVKHAEIPQQPGFRSYTFDPAQMPIYDQVAFPDWIKDQGTYQWQPAMGEKKIAVSGYSVKKSEVKDARIVRVSKSGEMTTPASVSTEPTDLGVFVDPDKVMEAISTLKVSSAGEVDELFKFKLPELRPQLCQPA